MRLYRVKLNIVATCETSHLTSSSIAHNAQLFEHSGRASEEGSMKPDNATELYFPSVGTACSWHSVELCPHAMNAATETTNHARSLSGGASIARQKVTQTLGFS